MRVPRETVYAAVLTMLNGITDFKTVGRVLVSFDDVLPADQPACYLTQGDEDVKHSGKQGLPNIYVIHPDVYIYVHQENVDTASDPVGKKLNSILDKIDNLFKPDGVREAITLGGLVQNVRISGRIVTDEGLLGSQAMAIVPLEIIV